MSARLQVPLHFRTFDYDGWTNAFEFLPPDCPRFYPNETLFGNWKSPVLVLAKDAAPSDVMRGLVEAEGSEGWRHAQRGRDPKGYRTNERLADLVRAHEIPVPLYGSAAAHMLCDVPGYSRELPGFYAGDLHDHLAETLRWVIGRMPNLSTIACLGVEAWYLTSVVLGYRWKTVTAAKRAAGVHRDTRQLIHGRVADSEISASCHFHPSRGGWDKWSIGWPELAARLQTQPSERKPASEGR